MGELPGITLDPAWIQVEEFGGTKKDLALPARYAARPLLGEDRGDYVMLDRPPTRFLILTDAENKYETIKGRHHRPTLGPRYRIGSSTSRRCSSVVSVWISRVNSVLVLSSSSCSLKS